MKKLPLGIQSFEKMRTENYLYVDKTRYIYRMATEGTFYFLSRPRRFGKSLLVSTLKCLFQGRRELFHDLWIAEHSDWRWQEHPVIALDFNAIPGDSPEQLQHYLAQHLLELADEAGIRLEPDHPAILFQKLIARLYKHSGQQVVVLIDEYDKRIIDHLGKGAQQLETAKANWDVLKTFFGVLKGQSVSDKLRFVFLTGVSRFTRVSIFSELNNLYDLSMDNAYVDMLGYTPEEVDRYFAAEIRQLAELAGVLVEQMKALLAFYYNGYRFADSDRRVYNPFSMLNAFRHQQIKAFWFESATPTFLVRLLQEGRFYLPSIENLSVSEAVFTAFELERLQPEALLFQTGYLTIQEVRQPIYTLGYPNQEVKLAFSEALLLGMTSGRQAELNSLVLQLPGYLQNQDFPAFFDTMQAVFASIPYDIQSKRDEAYFHTIFYLAMSASGMVNVESSVLTSKGRIDLAIRFPESVYIIEFKCEQSAATALRQIHKNRYAERYRSSAKPIFLLGINFDKEQRSISDWKCERA